MPDRLKRYPGGEQREAMTNPTESRLDRIETLLQRNTEALTALTLSPGAALDAALTRIAESQARSEARMDRAEALAQENTQAIAELREAQKQTDQRLESFIFEVQRQLTRVSGITEKNAAAIETWERNIFTA